MKENETYKIMEEIIVKSRALKMNAKMRYGIHYIANNKSNRNPNASL